MFIMFIGTYYCLLIVENTKLESFTLKEFINRLLKLNVSMLYNKNVLVKYSEY